MKPEVFDLAAISNNDVHAVELRSPRATGCGGCGGKSARRRWRDPGQGLPADKAGRLERGSAAWEPDHLHGAGRLHGAKVRKIGGTISGSGSGAIGELERIWPGPGDHGRVLPRCAEYPNPTLVVLNAAGDVSRVDGAPAVSVGGISVLASDASPITLGHDDSFTSFLKGAFGTLIVSQVALRRPRRHGVPA